MATLCKACGGILDAEDSACPRCQRGLRSPATRRLWIIGGLVTLAAGSEALFLAAVFLGHWGESVPFARLVHHALAHPSSRPVAERFQDAVSRHALDADGAASGWLPEVASVTLLIYGVIGAGYVFIYRSGLQGGPARLRPVLSVGVAGLANFAHPAARVWLMLATLNPVLALALVAGLVYAFVEVVVLAPEPGRRR
jgi:hypothetical protein